MFPCLLLPSSPFLLGLPSFQAWPNGDNMLWGDKHAHAASEGSLGKAMVVCALAWVATRGPDKSPAVGCRDCLQHTVFGDIQCVSQCRWSLCGRMAGCPKSCTASIQIKAVIYKHWNRWPQDASLQHGGTTGHGSISNQGQCCLKMQTLMVLRHSVPRIMRQLFYQWPWPFKMTALGILIKTKCWHSLAPCWLHNEARDKLIRP